jgi:hypothetical protein
MPVSRGSGELLEHGLAALGGIARRTNVTDVIDVRRLACAGGGLGVEGVVPGAVDGVALDRQGIQALPAGRDARGVLAGVQGGLDAQTAAGAGRRDGLDDHLVAGQWPAPPVDGDVGEQPVLDLVPLRRARRVVADRDR